MHIRAAVVEKSGGPFEISELELAPPRPHEVLVKVVASGVCRTDLHIRDREYPIPLPIVAGHEGAGVIVDVGTDVHRFHVGDRVLMSYPRCNACTYCQGGDPAYCEHGFNLSFGGSRLDGSSALERPGGLGHVYGHIFQQSSFATHSVVPETNLVHLPDDLPFELAAPFGCGFQTGAGSVTEALGVTSGSSIVVIGTGSVGLAAVMAAAAMSARTIIAVDTVETRRELALSVGATHALDPSDGELGELIRDVTGDGVDFALETTGLPHVLASGIGALRATGTLAMVGAAPAGTTAAIDMNTLMNGRRVRGVIQGDCTPQEYLPKLFDLHRAGKFPVERLISIYEFDDINKAAHDMSSGSAIKPVLRMPSI